MRIAVPVSGENPKKEIEKAAGAGADIIELRLDRLQNFEKLISDCPIQTIVSCPPEWAGGGYAKSESNRIEVLKKGIRAGADFVEIEFEMKPQQLEPMLEFLEKEMCSTIASAHLNKVPSKGELDVVWKECEKIGDFVKIVVPLESPEDCISILKKWEGEDGILAGTGKFGRAVGMLSPHFSPYLVYAPADDIGKIRKAKKVKLDAKYIEGLV